jgi:hypothetical protein
MQAAARGWRATAGSGRGQPPSTSGRQLPLRGMSAFLPTLFKRINKNAHNGF